MLTNTLKKPTLTSLFFIGGLAMSSVCAADEMGFKGNGEFGFSTTSGNTESESLYASLKMSYLRQQDEFQAKIEGNYQSEDNTTTQERYLLDGQYNRFYNQAHSYYSFVGARFEQNKFEGIQLESTFTPGLGKSLLKTESMALKGELGLGYQITDYTDSYASADDNQMVARAKLDYAYTINENVDFTQDLLITAGSDQTKTEANTGVKVKLAEQMRMKAGFKYRHNSVPAAGAEKVDTQTLLTLVYDF